MSLTVLASSAAAAARADGLQTVHIRVAGHEVECKSPALADSSGVFVPLEVLTATGVAWRIDRQDDAVEVRGTESGDRVEIPLAKLRGTPMLPLTAVARALHAVVVRPSAGTGDGAGAPGDTVYLLARVTDVAFVAGSLRVTTSFAVPYRVRDLVGATEVRGYVDCVGASIDPGFESTKCADRRVVDIHVGQNSPDVARVVVTLTAPPGLQVVDGSGNDQVTIVADLAKPGGRGRDGTADIRSTAGGDNGESGASTPPPETASSETTAPASSAHTGATAAAMARSRVSPSRGGSLGRVLEVTSATVVPISPNEARLNIDGTGTVRPSIRYGADGHSVIVDLPGTALNPAAADTTGLVVNHPLVRGVTARQVGSNPPDTQIVVALSRIVGFAVEPRPDGVSIDMRLPREATGALADKLIVIDPGHGGSSTGAIGRSRSGAVYEKNVTLAIGLKLRAALEAAGARVVMTRDSDVDVPLYARPRQANAIGADLFVSIHNDATPRANSASGTSTYFHASDPSSRALAVCIQQSVRAITGLPSRGAISDTAMYQHGFAVLRTSKMPAVLIEVAYINNSTDRAKLVSPAFQRHVARAICNGLRNYVEGSPQAATSSSDDQNAQQTP